RATRARRTPANDSTLEVNQDKPCLETPVVVTNPVDHTLTPFNMTRAELSSKRGGFIYNISPIDFTHWGVAYKPSGKYELKANYVWYDVSRTDVRGSTRELYDWIFRKLQLYSGTIKDALIAKHHRNWFDDYPSHPREEAMEMAQANVYVAMMLKEFQNDLSKCHTETGVSMVLTPQHIYAESQHLEVSPIYLLQGMGHLKNDESSWQVCEPPRHSSHVSYFNEYNFRSHDSQHKRWRELVQGFLHYIHKKSKGKTIVAQLDCNKYGMISNLVCFDKENQCHLADSEVIQRAFTHFGEDHKCNDVCHMLNM
ncbi:hypothetical protein DFH28DRAFT_853634, partial [Melampsora americana]